MSFDYIRLAEADFYFGCVAEVASTDRPRLVCYLCEIEDFGGVCVIGVHFFLIFCWYGVFVIGLTPISSFCFSLTVCECMLMKATSPCFRLGTSVLLKIIFLKRIGKRIDAVV